PGAAHVASVCLAGPGGRGDRPDGPVPGAVGPTATWRDGRCDRPAAGAGRGDDVSAEQRQPDGLPAPPARGGADDEQPGGIAGGAVQRAGQGAVEVLEPAGGGGGDPASARRPVERGWPAGAVLR